MKRSDFIKLLGLASAGMILSGMKGRLGYGEPKKVLVIGAGIAGLAAAKVLQDAGHEVIILEARERAGGRIWTDHSLDFPVDFGPSFLHSVRENPLAEIAMNNKLSIKKVDYSNYYLFDQEGKLLDDKNRLSHFAHVEKVLKKVQKAISKADKDQTVQNIVDGVLRGEKMDSATWDTLQWRLAQLEIQFGAEFKLLSATEPFSFETSTDDLFLVGGMSEIITRMAAGLDIRYNQRARIIRQADSMVSISTMGEDFEGDFALITLPLGVLKGNGLRFDPVFSTAKKNAITKLEVGNINRFALKFDGKFWDTDRDFIGHIGKRRNEFPIMTNLGYFEGKPGLVATVGNEYSKLLSKQEDSEKMVHIHQLLYQIYENVPMPIDMKYSAWEDQPFSQGAFSYVPSGVDRVARDYLARPEKRLYFAGEATIQEGAGTVLGAYNSGLRAAKWIIER